MPRNKFRGKTPVLFPKAVLLYIISLILITLASVCSSCSPGIVQVPVEVRTESLSIDSVRAASLRADTVIQADTVCIVLSQAGDTVRLTQTRWRDRVSVRVDTVAVVRVDTIYREKAVTINSVQPGEVKKMSSLRIAAAILTAPVAFLILVLLSRFRTGLKTFFSSLINSLLKKKS